MESKYLLILGILAVLFLAPSLSHAVSFPTGVIASSQVNITNSQTVGAGNSTTGFQQMINISLTNYRGYINDTGKYSFQNVEFFNSTSGAVLNSWLESYSFTNNWALYWVKLPDGIGASQTLSNVYVGFGLNTTSFWSNTSVGEAPQLSPNYGGRDDGVSIFTNYWNFAGTTLPSGFSTAPSGDGSYTVNNSLTVSNNANTQFQVYYNTLINPVGLIGEIYTQSTSGNEDSGISWDVDILQNGTGGTPGWWGHTTGMLTEYNPGDSSGPDRQTTFNAGTAATAYPSIHNLAPPMIMGASWQSASAMGSFWGYSSSVTASSETSAPVSAYLAVSTSGGAAASIEIYWLRNRAYPPNNVMPSISQGSLILLPMLVLYLNGVKDANTTITYGTQSNFTCLSNDGNYCRIYVNGTAVNSYAKSTNTYLKSYYSSGLYKVTSQTNTSGIANVTYYETISKANATISLSASLANFTYNGTKENLSYSIKALNNLNWSITVNSSATHTLYYKSGYTNVSNYYANATAGEYIAYLNVQGNQNYSTKTIHLIRRISTVSQTSTIFLNSVKTNDTLNYTTQLIPIDVQTNLLQNLSINLYYEYPNSTVIKYATYYPSLNAYNYSTSYRSPLNPAGAYLFFVNTTGNINYSKGTSNIMKETLYLPYPILAVSLSTQFIGESNIMSVRSAFNTSNIVRLKLTNRKQNITYITSTNVNYLLYTETSLAIGNYTVTGIDNNTNLTTSENISVIPIQFYPCGSSPALHGGVFNPVLNFTFENENTFALYKNITNTTGYLSVNGGISSGGQVGYVNNSAQLAKGFLCIGMVSAPSQTVSADGLLNYENKLKILRSYELLNTPLTNGVIHTITLYMLDNVSGSGQVGFYVLTNQGQQVATYVQAYRYYPNTNSFSLVDFFLTATQGYSYRTLEVNQLYDFNIYNTNGTLLYITNSLLIPSSCASGCQQVLVINAVQNLSKTVLSGISANCQFTNASGIKYVNCGVSSGTSTSINYTLTTFSEGDAGNQTICTTHLDTPDGTLLCSFNTASFNGSTIYEYVLYANVGGSNILLASGTQGLARVGLFGTLGLIIAFIMIFCITLLAIYNPPLMMIIDVIIIFIMGYFGIFLLSIEAFISLVVVLIIYLWISRGTNG